MPKTRVTFLLDKSGSMSPIKNDTMGAFNAYLSALQKDPEGIIFSLIQFDAASIETTCKNVPVKEAPALNDHNYKPLGGTPLIDAAYKTIKAVEAVAKKKDKVVIAIQTDGEENSSREYTMAQLSALIKEKTELGWQFNFMGVGLDAYSQGAAMGIGRGNTVAYSSEATTAGAFARGQMFAANAMNTVNFAKGLSASTAYSPEQKSASGDTWDDVNAKLDEAIKKAPSRSVARRLAAKKADVDLT